jgi:translocation and assembly module TamB
LRKIALILLLYLGCANVALAQEDDRGFLTRKIEEALAGAGRDVRLEGFRGVLTSQASFDSLTIADEDGIWLSLTEVVLDWKRAALLRGRIEVNTLSAKSLDLKRIPKTEQKTEVPDAEASGFSLPELPVAINIAEFRVDEITLGEPILGEAVALSIAASAMLEDGTFATNLNADRTDGKMGRFLIDASFEQATEMLAVKLEVVEDAGGIAARMMNLPGHPELDLTVDGTGVLSDFVAQIALAANDEPRLTGQVELSAEPVAEGQTQPARRIQAELGGDIAALLAPQYQPFFGDNIALDVDVYRAEDGSIDVREFSLVAQQANLDGQVRLNSEYWPVYLDVDAKIGHPDGNAVLLPLGGPETRVSGMELSVQFDAANGDSLDAVFDVRDISRDGNEISQARVQMAGNLHGEVGYVGQVVGDVTAAVTGLRLADPGLSEAVGSALNVSTNVNYIEGQPVRLSDLVATGEDYGVRGRVIINDPESGLLTRMNVRVDAQDISRFSGVADRALAGAVAVTLSGEVAPLAGTFDVEVKGQSDDLKVDQTQADILMAGRTQLDIAARRTTEGFQVSKLELSNPALQAQGQADLSTGDSQVQLDATLRDISLLAPEYTGSLSVAGRAEEDASGWSVDAKADGPYESRAMVKGRVTGPDADVDFEASLPDIRVFVPQIPGPLSTKGNAKKAADGWQVVLSADGPSGTRADVSGLVAQSGDLDLKIAGTAPLGLTAPFLKPRVLQGPATFDLALNGPPALSSVSGTIGTAGATFSAPNLRIALTNIDTNVTLSGASANVDVSAAVENGGSLKVSGPIGLTGGLNSDLSILLTSVKLIDPSLYETILDGTITVNGPLTGGAQIAGRIDVGQTEIKVPASGLNAIGDIPDIRHVAEPSLVYLTRERAGLIQDENAAANSGSAGPAYPLAVTVNAPRIFVRGRGLEAELGGQLQIRGTTRNIISSGRFDLIRGRLDILAKRFNLDEGIIQLQGSFLPYVRFVTSNTTQDFTAKIILEGPVDDPEITLESTPDAPEDEILAQLMFGQSVSEMSAFQALRLASAVAVLAGGGSIGVVKNLRTGFGLDNLDITTDEDGVTQVEAGKYLTENIYTEVTAGTDGGSEVSLNIDLTKSLTAKGAVDDEGESSVGLFFERDY